MNTRECRTCKDPQPLTEFRLWRGYRQRHCLTCERAKALARYHATKPVDKYCPCCTRTLALDRFAMRIRNGRDTPNPVCKQCQSGRDAVRYRNRNSKPQPGERPTYYRAAVEKVCDGFADAWRGPVNAGTLVPAIGINVLELGMAA